MAYGTAGWTEVQLAPGNCDPVSQTPSPPTCVDGGPVLQGHKQDRDFLALSGFDTAFYLDRYPDVRVAGADPIQHYLDWGANEGRRPHPFFDSAWYLRHNPEVARSNTNPFIHYVRHGRAEGRKGQKAAAVYTAIFGNFDELRPPIRIDPELDYFVFGDEWVVDPPEPWIKMPLSWSAANPRLAGKFVKTHAAELLPGYEIWFWADASFQLDDVRAQRLEAILQRSPIAFFAHPERDCSYAEADSVIARGLDQPDAVERVIRHLEAHQFPRKAGLAATGLLIQRNNTALNCAIHEWWNLIESGSPRDQLSFPFVLSHKQLPYTVIPGSIWSNELGEYRGHRPAPWRGLQCGGAYLDFGEYEAIEAMVRSLGIRSAIEIGAGETSILFSRLGVSTLSIEYRSGPWLHRAREHGCDVVEAHFDTETRTFSVVDLAAHLKRRAAVDLLFIDSPTGTQNRRHILESILEYVRVRYVLYHDAWRDAPNIFRDQQRFRLKPVHVEESERGLALFEIERPNRLLGGWLHKRAGRKGRAALRQLSGAKTEPPRKTGEAR